MFGIQTRIDFFFFGSISFSFLFPKFSKMNKHTFMEKWILWQGHTNQSLRRPNGLKNKRRSSRALVLRRGASHLGSWDPGFCLPFAFHTGNWHMASDTSGCPISGSDPWGGWQRPRGWASPGVSASAGPRWGCRNLHFQQVLKAAAAGDSSPVHPAAIPTGRRAPRAPAPPQPRSAAGSTLTGVKGQNLHRIKSLRSTKMHVNDDRAGM